MFKYNKIKKDTENKKYHLRKQNFEIYHRTHFYEKTPTYLINKIVKTLPDYMKQEKNQKRFLKYLKDFVISREPYSIAEFL